MRAFIVIAIVLLAAPAWAQGARERLVASPSWLAKRLGEPGLVILQVGDRAAYEAGHIPGSRLVTAAELAAPTGGDALSLELPDPAVLRARLSALGVGDTSQIVVVPTREAGIQSATRVVFTLDTAGLGGRTRLLEGGAAAWAAEGRPLSTQAPKPASPARLSPIRYRSAVVDAEFVRRHARAPGYRLVDARLPEFYDGARTGGSPERPHKTGHIAGAVNVPFNTVARSDLTLAPAAEIAARFRAAGVKRGDTVIAYCHIGQQASATLFAARTLGLKVKLYDGSFEEWSRLGGAVATGPR